MKQTTEQLKALRDNAPKGATHSDNERDYFKRTDNTQQSATQWEMWSGHNWYFTHGTPDFALADIAEIIELREQIEAMHKAWNKNQAKDQDLLHECSNENAKLREKLEQAKTEIVTAKVDAFNISTLQISNYLWTHNKIEIHSNYLIPFLHNFCLHFKNQNTNKDKGE